MTKKRQLKFWATQRGRSTSLPCLWGTRREALSQADPDERVVRVSVTIERTVREPLPELRGRLNMGEGQW